MCVGQSVNSNEDLLCEWTLILCWSLTDSRFISFLGFIWPSVPWSQTPYVIFTLSSKEVIVQISWESVVSEMWREVPKCCLRWCKVVSFSQDVCQILRHQLSIQGRSWQHTLKHCLSQFWPTKVCETKLGSNSFWQGQLGNLLAKLVVFISIY